jgi:hypothetical protein
MGWFSALRGSAVLRLLAIVMAAGVLPTHAQDTLDKEGPLTIGQPKTAAQPTLIDNDTIIRMFKAGIGDDVIIQTIQLQPGHYDTSPDALIALKQAGVSDHVLSIMQAHGTGLAVRTQRPQSTDPVEAPTLLPPPGIEGIGIYYKDTRGVWVPMESEIVHIQSGGFLKSTLTHNIIKEDHNGVVTGTEAKLVLPRPVEFLLYTPDGTDGGEYELIRFRLNSKNREFRVLTGGVIHSTGGAQRDDVEIHPVKTAPRTWTFSLPGDIPGAEYGILPPGTGNVTNGGKIYTFAIVEPK